MAATVNKKQTSSGNFALYIGLFLLLLGLNGALQFIVADFKWDTLMTASYWFKTITGAGSGLAAFIIFAFIRRDAAILKDKDYNDDIDEMNDVIKTEVDDDFPEYIAYENREMKVSKWQQKQENKLIRWNNRVSARVLRDIKLIEDERWNFNPKWWQIFSRLNQKRRHKKASRWIRRRNKIKLHLSNEWIQENIDYIKQKYPDITVGEILTGQRNSSSNKIIDNSAMRHIFKDRMPLIMLTTTGQALYHALNILQAVNPASIIMGIIIQLITIFLNAGTGSRYGNTLFDKLDKNNLFTRKTYLMGYLKWKKAKKSTDS